MLATLIGWIGTIGSLGAYVLLSQGRWHATSLRYCALNFVAAGLMGGASAAYHAWPSVGANLLWSGIALHSAITTLHQRRAAAAARAHPAAFLDDDPESPTGPHPVLLNAA